MGTIPEDENCFLRDFNGHIGKETGNFDSVHGGFSFGVRNKSGENLIEFEVAKELVITNLIYIKKMSMY